MKTSLGLQEVSFVTFLKEKKNVLLVGSFKIVEIYSNRIKTHSLKKIFYLCNSVQYKISQHESVFPLAYLYKTNLCYPTLP